MADDQESRSQESGVDGAIKKLGYTKSLLFVFVIPFVFLFRTMVRNTQKAPFFLSIAVVCLLGWSWSMLLSYQHWWVFPERYILGIRPLPYLPLEEFLIYPMGGAFSIFFYAFATRRFSTASVPVAVWSYLAVISAAFVALGISKADTRPYYLYSQLLLYNGLCLILAPFAASRINLRGLIFSAVILGTIGFIWDYFAFKFEWWVYFAITGLKIEGIPIEDVNFYLMAPAAAITLYVALCRGFGVPQTPTDG